MTWWNILLNYSSHSLQQSPEASQRVSHLPVVMCLVQWGCPGLNCLQAFLDSIQYMFLSHPTQPDEVSLLILCCKGYIHLMKYLYWFLAIFRPSPDTYMYLKIMFFQHMHSIPTFTLISVPWQRPVLGIVPVSMWLCYMGFVLNLSP